MSQDSFHAPPQESPPATRSRVMEILMPLLFIAAWVALQLWLLPRFGVET